MRKLILAASAAGCLVGCSSVSQVQGFINGANAIDMGTYAAAGFIAYQIATFPSWEVQLRELPGEKAAIALSKRPYAQDGDGYASMAFREAAKQFCGGKGLVHSVLSYEEYFEAQMLGAQRKAKGAIACVERSNG